MRLTISRSQYGIRNTSHKMCASYESPAGHMRNSISDTPNIEDPTIRDIQHTDIGQLVINLGDIKFLVLPLSGPLTEIAVMNWQSMRTSVWCLGTEEPRHFIIDRPSSNGRYEIVDNDYCQAVSLTTNELRSNFCARQLLQDLNLYNEDDCEQIFLKFLINYAETVRTYDTDKFEIYVALLIFKDKYDFTINDIILEYRPMLPKVILPTARPTGYDGCHKYDIKSKVENVRDFDFAQLTRFYDERGLDQNQEFNRSDNDFIGHIALKKDFNLLTKDSSLGTSKFNVLFTCCIYE